MQKPSTREDSCAQTPRKVEDRYQYPPGGATETLESDLVYLRVRRDFILPIPTLTSIPPPAQPLLTGHIYLIESTLGDIKRYAGAMVDWVIKIAQLICDPFREGRLYTHTTETPSHWHDSDRTPEWRQVVLGDPLQPGIYEFEPVGSVCLSRISERNKHSKTTEDSRPFSTRFRNEVGECDGKCVVTQTSSPVVASHLIPKRLGTDGAQAVAERFCGMQDAANIHKFDPRIGVLLTTNLDFMRIPFRLDSITLR